METIETNYGELKRKSAMMLTTLKPEGRREHVYSATVNFASYTCLICSIADLMKLCTMALGSDDLYVSDTIRRNSIDLVNVMEIALQLLPYNEAEFLDEARSILGREIVVALPEFNYSTVVVLE